MFWCCTWTSLHSSFLLFLFKVVVCLLQQLDFPGWQLCWTILFLAVGGLSRAVIFLWGSDVGVENSKWWQFPKWWKEMDSSLQGSMCALGRCAEVPPRSPISLLSSRFRSRAPFGVLGSQMDQTHTHRSDADLIPGCLWTLVDQTLHRMNCVWFPPRAFFSLPWNFPPGA